MPGIYSITIFIICLSLIVLSILVRENNRIPVGDKWRFYLAYFLIAFSAAAEWTGVHLSGNPEIPQWALLLAKALDYTCTPLAGAAIIAPMKPNRLLRSAMFCILGFNALFQIICIFTGGMIVIDPVSFQYSHGPLYVIYVGVYLLVFALVIIQFIIYGYSFSRHNKLSLWAIMILIFSGIAIQEFMGPDYRVAYLSLTIGVAMLFIHYAEFSQIASDDYIAQQDKHLATDVLTGIQSRFPYAAKLREYNEPGSMPESMVVFLIDINGLKRVNDEFGHDAGDELICGAANCLVKVFGKRSDVFRIGGDEFVVLCTKDRKQAEACDAALESESAAWSGKKVGSLSLSSGFALASEHRDLSLAQLVKMADDMMYAEKEDYYREHGIDRRIL